MPNPVQRDVRFDFRKGVNNSYSDDVLDSMEVERAQNLEISETYGALRKANGSIRIHTGTVASGADVDGVFQWENPSGDLETVAVAGGNFYHKVEADAAFTEVTTLTLPTGEPIHFQVHRDGSAIVLYFADGTALRRWDGTTLSTVSGAPSGATLLELYKGRMFTTVGKTLYWSQTNEPETWAVVDGGGFADVETYDTQDISGLLTVGSSLLIFKRDNVARFTGVSNADIQIDSQTDGVSSEVGLIGVRGLAKVEEISVFATDRGVYVADEMGVRDISGKIRRAYEEANWDAMDSVVVAYNRRRHTVYLGIPTGSSTVPDEWWLYNTRLQAWCGPRLYPWTGTVCASRYEDGSGRESLVCGATDGILRQMDYEEGVCRDDKARAGTGGSTIAWQVKLPELVFGYPSRQKSLRTLQILSGEFGDGNTVTVDWENENGDTGSLTLTGQVAEAADLPWRTKAVGSRIGLTFSEDSEFPTVIRGITLAAHVSHKRRRGSTA